MTAFGTLAFFMLAGAWIYPDRAGAYVAKIVKAYRREMDAGDE